MLVFADLVACCSLDGGLSSDAPPAEILRHPSVCSHFQSLLKGFAAGATGSSNRVVRAILVEEPPSLDDGEITDKGSLNQRAVIERRAALIEQLYAVEASNTILRITEK